MRSDYQARTSANELIQRLRQEGKLTPQPCEVCGAQPALAHHDNYAEPTQVRWLCRKHHAERHKELGWGFGNGRTTRIKKTTVNLMLPKALIAKLNEAAATTRRTKSGYLELALEDRLQKDDFSLPAKKAGDK